MLAAAFILSALCLLVASDGQNEHAPAPPPTGERP
jgi:hypothetical protein